MKTILQTIIIVFLLCLTSCEGKDSSYPALSKLEQPPVGFEAYPFTLSTTATTQKSLIDYRGHKVILNFWALWCAPCVAELPALSEMQSKLTNAGVRIVAINVDPPSKKEEVFGMVTSNNYQFETLLDPEMTTVNNYGVTGFPETFFIDESGKFFAVRDPDSGELATKFIRDRPWNSEPYLSLFTDR